MLLKLLIIILHIYNETVRYQRGVQYFYTVKFLLFAVKIMRYITEVEAVVISFNSKATEAKPQLTGNGKLPVLTDMVCVSRIGTHFAMIRLDSNSAGTRSGIHTLDGPKNMLRLLLPAHSFSSGCEICQ
jgi:hypothetical protein